MAVTIDGTSGITTPAETVSGASTVGSIQAGGITTNLYPLVSGTAQATTSGTSIDFTGIPSWAKRITVAFNAVSTNGSSIIQLQLGAGSVDSSGYAGTVAQALNTAMNFSSITSGIAINGAGNAAYTLTGHALLTLVGTNFWVASVNFGGSGNFCVNGGYTKTLSGTLDRIRLTTVNGTDTFDAGSINILYE